MTSDAEVMFWLDAQKAVEVVSNRMMEVLSKMELAAAQRDLYYRRLMEKL